jgi:hypothetical protein
VEDGDGALFMDNYSHAYFSRSIQTSGPTLRRDAKWSGVMFLPNKRRLINPQCKVAPPFLPSMTELFSFESALLKNIWASIKMVHQKKLSGSVCAVMKLYVTPMQYPIDANGNLLISTVYSTEQVEARPQSLEIHKYDVTANKGFAFVLLDEWKVATTKGPRQCPVLWDSGNYWRFWKLLSSPVSQVNPEALMWQQPLLAPWHSFKEGMLLLWGHQFAPFFRSLWWTLYPRVAWLRKPAFTNLQQLMSILAVEAVEMEDEILAAVAADTGNLQLLAFKDLLLFWLPMVCAFSCFRPILAFSVINL